MTDSAATETYAFALKLRPGMAAEYKRRHDAIWPEMTAMLLGSGILRQRIVRKSGPGFPPRTMRRLRQKSIGWIPKVEATFGSDAQGCSAHSPAT
jgi:hypothetical protein